MNSKQHPGKLEGERRAPSVVSGSRRGGRRLIKASLWLTLAALLTLALLPQVAAAARARYVLHYGDAQLAWDRGNPSVLYLKKALIEQYPQVDPRGLELRRVVLVAKSRWGMGDATLRVGNRYTAPAPVGGLPEQFHTGHRHSFDRIRLDNPSPGSLGPWRVGLRGNFIVRKVVLVVDEHPRHELPRWGVNHRGRW